jgi:hypothetical protein
MGERGKRVSRQTERRREKERMKKREGKYCEE